MRKTALLLFMTALALMPLGALENTTYLSISAGGTLEPYGEELSGQAVYGATVVGELIWPDTFLGMG